MTPEEIQDLDIHERLALAEDLTSTSPQVLEALADDTDLHVRCRVARNPNTPIHVLEILVNDSRWGVRHNVANNCSMSLAATEDLIRVGDWLIRECVIKHSKHITADMLILLGQDSHDRVRKAALERI
jgi:hypothetical protein